MFVRLTAESQNSSQDPDRGADSRFESRSVRWDVAVAQRRAVTHSHWCAERKQAGQLGLMKQTLKWGSVATRRTNNILPVVDNPLNDLSLQK